MAKYCSALSFVLIVSTAILVPMFVFGGSIKNISTNGFSFTPNKGDARPVYAIGDVNDVLAGHVSPSARENQWPAKGIIGFGAATVGPMSALGESFFANGHAFVRQTDNTTQNYFETVSDQTFRTPFSMYVTDDLVSDGTASFQAGVSAESNSISIMAFYEMVHEAVQGLPFCFHGFILFRSMDAIAVSKAPVYGEPLFGSYKNEYYAKPNFKIPDAYGLIFGCVANFSKVADFDLFEKLGRALYFNPKEQQTVKTLEVHSHVLTLKNDIEKLEQVSPETALGVYHLLSHATVQSISVNVFKIDTSAKLIEKKIPVAESGVAATISKNCVMKLDNLQYIVIIALSTVLSSRFVIH